MDRRRFGLFGRGGGGGRAPLGRPPGLGGRERAYGLAPERRGRPERGAVTNAEPSGRGVIAITGPGAGGRRARDGLFRLTGGRQALAVGRFSHYFPCLLRESSA